MAWHRYMSHWLPGYVRSLWRTPVDPSQPVRVWVAICDHYEPMQGRTDLAAGRRRVERWASQWPEIAKRHCGSDGRPAQYTFFFPQEEYYPELIDPLAALTHASLGDVEIHLHHDGEGEQDFVDRIEGFKSALVNRHGLLRTERGRVTFGFIHGNWALDNSRDDGRWCGLNNEITLLRDLGCYADFTMPSGASSTQSSLVNTIYWATDDCGRPKSYDRGTPYELGLPKGDLLMIPGPLALFQRGLRPRLETGELATHNPVSPDRVKAWLSAAPRLDNDIFVKLFAHGAADKNASVLDAGLAQMFKVLESECRTRGWNWQYVTAHEMYRRILQPTSERQSAMGNLSASTVELSVSS
jgi:hypothetical protein